MLPAPRIEPGEVCPQIGETLLVVPQAYAYLMRQGSEGSMIGKSTNDLPPYPTSYGYPCWASFSAEMPGFGYGLLLLRDNKFVRGPAQWDTSD